MGVEDEDLSFGSSQELGAAVRADARIRVRGWSDATRVSATAAGNTGEAAADGGLLEASALQTANGPVTARARLRGAENPTDDASASATALGNSHDFRAGFSAIGVEQTAAGRVRATADADLMDVFGQADISATAVGNNVDSQGNGAEIAARQEKRGATRADAKGDIYFAGTANATSVASGNNLSAAHDAPYLGVTAEQANHGRVAARTQLAVQEFGAAFVSADGMGNNAFAAVYGPDAALDITQDNGGEITVGADFTGGAGGEASVRASAMGNTIVGFACGDCDADLEATSRQTNSGAVTSTTRSNGGAGSTGSTVQAIGNNAIYQAIRPGQ